jgi:hypothetical protein
VFGVPRLPIHFEQHERHDPLVIGIENILTFKSPVIRMMLTPEALCVRDTRRISPSPPSGAKRCNSPIACSERSAAPHPDRSCCSDSQSAYRTCGGSVADLTCLPALISPVLGLWTCPYGLLDLGA